KLLWTTQLIKELNNIESECMKKSGNLYKLEGANPWSGIAVDQERGIVFITTGDARGENNKRPGDNLYSNSIVAIDILKGEIIWSFQEVNHDVWDLDISAPPIVTSITRSNKKIDVVIAVTKLGNTIILDRLTGKPIYPFRYIRTATPLDKLKYTSAYFPDPLIPEPFVKSKRLNSNDIRIQSNAINLNLAFPPSYPSPKKESLVFGTNGGAEWPGASVDPFSEIMYVASNNFYFLFPSFKPFLGADGNPGNTPPWGLLTALNLKSGKIIWSVPLGIDIDKLSKNLLFFGTKNLCGPVATAGGLVFCGGTTDKLFRAFDKDNGKELWSHELPAYGSAPPSIYQVNGKQYIIIPATGGINGTLHEKKHDSSDSFVVFTLP
ncbi:MAG: PQQ-binding-like beta-propeller repeat protein, partial [Rickettsiaceae bacterium]|nr:PQQ-binding-like beta-propeller repeat protein [Rickettsiaceae bacterium]